LPKRYTSKAKFAKNIALTLERMIHTELQDTLVDERLKRFHIIEKVIAQKLDIIYVRLKHAAEMNNDSPTSL